MPVGLLVYPEAIGDGASEPTATGRHSRSTVAGGSVLNNFKPWFAQLFPRGESAVKLATGVCKES
jgi:hypothetical protein